MHKPALDNPEGSSHHSVDGDFSHEEEDSFDQISDECAYEQCVKNSDVKEYFDAHPTISDQQTAI